MYYGQRKKPKKRRRLLRLLVLLLIVVGAFYLTTPYRLSPEGAARAGMSVDFKLMLAADFPGGKALLVEQMDAGYQLVMVRRWGPLWHPVTGATLWHPFGHRPVSWTLATTKLSGDQMAIAVAGLVADPRTARIVVSRPEAPGATQGTASGGVAVPAVAQAPMEHVQTADVAGKTAYLLIWTADSAPSLLAPQVQALDAAGQVLGIGDGP